LLDSNETGGLIVIHLESFLVWYTAEDSFIIGVARGKKWGRLRSPKALEFESGGLEPIAALQKFTPMEFW